MGRAEAPGRISSTFLLTFVAAVIASAVAVGMLYAFYTPQAPDGGARSAERATGEDGMTAEERRELTRQMLKARRENPEAPAEVRPTPSSRPATSATAEAAVAGTADLKARPDRLGGPAGIAPARAAARNKPDPAGQAAAVAPGGSAASKLASITSGGAQNSTPPAGPGAAPQATATPGVTLPPVVVSTSAVKPPPGAISDPNAAVGPVAGGDPAAPDAPARRGFAANVFSTISVFAGSAANATGNTVNWVIDLPGRAVSAGGKLLGVGSGAANSPANPPGNPSANAPADAPATPFSQSPPPKRS